MKYSELELKKLGKPGALSIEDEIKYNILSFIRAIHLNKRDFITESYNTVFSGDLEMTFRKRGGQVAGYIHVSAKKKGWERSYIFTDEGYEPLEELLELK